MKPSTKLALFGQLATRGAASIFNLTLPWGVWQSEYNACSDVYTFSNVRFGAAPVDALRFQHAQYPSHESTEIHVSSDVSCHQVNELGTCASGYHSPIHTASSPAEDEDCLFLDIYVPGSVMKKAHSIANASVVVWLHGGAFVYGSKNWMMDDGYHTPFFNGTDIVKYAVADTIFVAGNYRLGAFGWLAGTTMESQGYPNAGLSDQRLLFDWVKKYIHQVGGNRHKVSAWGQSAGASSIMHHLVSRDENDEALGTDFQRAILSSPAYQWIWPTHNRTSYAEQAFINFTCLACAAAQDPRDFCCKDGELQSEPVYTVRQLAQMHPSVLRDANQRLFQSTYQCTGMYPVGPAVDRKIIRHLAPVELANGNIALLDSLIVSHVQDEASAFISAINITSEADYNRTLAAFFSHDFSVRAAIAARYPVSASNGSQLLRLHATMQDSLFLSNNRLLLDAYTRAGTRTYALAWDGLDLSSAGLGDLSTHGTDLLPLFHDAAWDLRGFLGRRVPGAAAVPPALFALFRRYAFQPGAAMPYKRYFSAHAAAGDPNAWPGERWDVAVPRAGGVDGTMTLALRDFAYYWTRGRDEALSADMAEFWTWVAREVEGL